ncbi:L,D-transpeptidase family protein [Ignatzschineria sp. LJL83]
MTMRRFLLSASLLISVAVAQKHVEYTQPEKGNDLIGEIMYVTPIKHESLADLTIRYEMGYDELRWANPGINAWLLDDKTPFILPTQFILPEGKRSGIVSNIPEMRTYYFLKGTDKIYVYPVGVGRMDWKTPIGSWAITRKQENPPWYPPESIRKEHAEMGRGTLPRMVPAGPENPLGTRVLRLALPSYLLHGTNEQTGIGMRVTHGCMRFYPQHIEHLYEMVPTKTMVTFLNEPVKYGFLNNDLYMEVHPPLEEDELSVEGLREKALTQLEKFLKPYPNSIINYDIVNLAVRQQTGIPVNIGQKETYRAPQFPVNQSPQIELYSEPLRNTTAPYSVQQSSPPKLVVPSTSPRDRNTTINSKEIRLTPDPRTIIVPESVSEETGEVIFPEPSSYRFQY